MNWSYNYVLCTGNKTTNIIKLFSLRNIQFSGSDKQVNSQINIKVWEGL